jgi:predicted nicotinamide N-methyase
MPNVLLNTLYKPQDSDIDNKGMYELEIDLDETSKLPAGFIAGDWSSQVVDGEDKKYDLILTSETIYEAMSHKKLYELIKRSLSPNGIA